MPCPHCNTIIPRFCSECGKPVSQRRPRFCSECGQPLPPPVAARAAAPVPVAAPVADSPSTDRIKQEIRNKEREIADIRRNIDERTEEYERKGYRNADPGWYIPLYKEIDKLAEEIRRLTSSL
jgi:hypothetical protein